MSFNFMTAVIVQSDFGAQEKKATLDKTFLADTENP